MLQAPMIGLFFASFGLLSFELLCPRIIDIAAGSGGIPAVLGIAMLGLGAAATFASSLSDNTIDAVYGAWIAPLCALNSLAMSGAFAAAALICSGLDAELGRLLASGGPAAAADFLSRTNLSRLLILGAVLAVPHFVSGFIITVIFRSSGSGRYPDLYAMDLFGAATGCLACVLLMEYGGYRWPAALTVLMPLLAGFTLAREHRGRWAGGLAVILILSQVSATHPALSGYFEPTTNLRMLGHAYAPGTEVSEVWRSWNSHSRVAELLIKNAYGTERSVFAFGSGQGHASFDAYKAEYGPSPIPDIKTEMAAALGIPRRALILFAGVGSEAIALDRLSGGRTDITAVEVNRPMLKRALGVKERGLAEFFARPNVSLRVEEARAFLERDKSRYDLILAPYFGSAYSSLWAGGGELAQFTFTREAYKTMLERLAPGGAILVYDINKVILAAAIRSIFEEAGRKDAGDCAVIMSPIPLDAGRFFHPEPHRGGAAFHFREWNTPLDNLGMYIKPSGFSSADAARLRALSRRGDFPILYAPWTKDESNPYFQALRGGNWKEGPAGSRKAGYIKLSARTDDTPALDRPYLAGLADLLDVRLARLALWIFGFGTILALSALIFRSGAGVFRDDLFLFVFFAATGCAYTLVEFGFIQKFTLYLGSPVYAMSVSLAALLFFSGLGSLSLRHAPSGKTIAASSFLAAVTLAALTASAEKYGQLLFALPPGAEIAAVALTLGIPSFFMGRLFPEGLELARRRGSARTAWAWAVNGYFAAAGVAAAVIAAQTLGINSLLWAGCSIYLGLSVLSRFAAAP